MGTVTERIEDAVSSLNESGDIAAKFIDPAQLTDVVGKSGNLKPLAAIAKDAGDIVIQFDEDTKVLKIAAELEISRIGEFTKEIFAPGTTYTESNIYFIENSIAYTPINIPFTASSLIETDIDSGALTVRQGMTSSDIGRKGAKIVKAQDTVISLDDFAAAVNEDLDIGQRVGIKDRLAECLVVPGGIGVADNDRLFDMGNGNKLKLIIEGQVDTFADLRLREPKHSNEIIYMAGHTEPMHGAGAFIGDLVDKLTPDDNGMTAVTTGGNRWKRINVQNIFISYYGALSSATAEVNTVAIQGAIDYLEAGVGGALGIPWAKYKYNGVNILNPAKNIEIFGLGWRSHLENVAVDGSHAILVHGDNFEDPVLGLKFTGFRLSGNAASGNGIQFDKLGRFNEDANVTTAEHMYFDNHGLAGIQYGESTESGAGNNLTVSKCKFYQCKTGIEVVGQSNLLQLIGNSITNCTEDGIYLNQTASTCSIKGNAIFDNGRFGVHAFRCEQPIITFNGFNRNGYGAVVFNGDPEGSASVKYTEAGFISANLFGDNGNSSAAGSRTEISIRASRGTMIENNYFYLTDSDRYIYVSDYVEGLIVRSNHWKDFTSVDEAKKVVLKADGINQYAIFDDDIRTDATQNIHMINKSLQYLISASGTLFQMRNKIDDSSPVFRINGKGKLEWSDGNTPSDVNFGRNKAGTLAVLAADGGTANNFACGALELQNRDSAPTFVSNHAKLFVIDNVLTAVTATGSTPIATLN